MTDIYRNHRAEMALLAGGSGLGIGAVQGLVSRIFTQQGALESIIMRTISRLEANELAATSGGSAALAARYSRQAQIARQILINVRAQFAGATARGAGSMALSIPGEINAAGMTQAEIIAVNTMSAEISSTWNSWRLMTVLGRSAVGGIAGLAGFMIIDNFIFPEHAGHPTEATVDSVTRHPEVLLAANPDLVCTYVDTYSTVRSSALRFVADLRHTRDEMQAFIDNERVAADAAGLRPEDIGAGSMPLLSGTAAIGAITGSSAL